MTPFLALLTRDLRLSVREGGGAVLALGFFALVATLVPLGVGPDLNLLAKMGGGILWVGAALAALLSLDRLFQADYEDGSLDLIALSPLSLEGAAFAKIAAHWLSTGLPLTLLSPILSVFFGLSGSAVIALTMSLAIGTPAVSAVGAIGASLTLSLRRGGLILPLIVLPLLVPAVMFGAGMVLEAQTGLTNGAVGFLAAFSLAASLLSPFVAAQGVRLNLAG
ncbi:MAG: heme exporter protein CcmB [Alphaproteobacteria bacterium]|nr:heme exporter protein CcmB [Alphaproteobacteria bacterium]